jgi:hypothetical protein
MGHIPFALVLALAIAPLASPVAPWALDDSAEASPPEGAGPECLIVIDRHNHKTGGTTVRDIFTHQQAGARCFYWGYGPATPLWDELMEILENNGQPLRSAPGKPFRLCLELHFRVPYWPTSVPRCARHARPTLIIHATASATHARTFWPSPLGM